MSRPDRSPAAPLRAREAAWGSFELPPDPPAQDRLLPDPSWSARRLSLAVLARVWPWVTAGSLLRVVHTVCSMLVPVAVGAFVDAVVVPATRGARPPELWPALALWLGVLAGLYVAINIGNRLGGRLGWVGVQTAQFELTQAVLRRILDPRGSAGPARSPGGLLSVATADVHRSCLVLYMVVYPPAEIIGLLVAAVVLIGIHPWLGIGVVLGLPAVLALMHVAALPLQRRSRRQQERIEDAVGAAADLVQGYRVLRGLHAHGIAVSRYERVNDRALEATLSARRAEASFEGLSAGLTQSFGVVVAVVAAWMALRGLLSPGDLVTVAGLAVTLVGPFQSLVSNVGESWAVSQASAARVLELLRTDHHPASAGRAAPPEEVCLRLDRLRLPSGGTVDLDLRAGELVVLDPPALDQRFLAELLSLRVEPVAGAVRLGGDDLGSLEPALVRARLLVAPHTPGLFAGSVLDNARATGDAPGPDAARAALVAAGLHAHELPQGYDTVVGSDGWSLSGGQRQRVALARAVAADPDLLVLVEPTTSVDAVTELGIAQAVRDARRHRATLVVSGSPAWAAVALRVVDAEGGDADG